MFLVMIIFLVKTSQEFFNRQLVPARQRLSELPAFLRS